MQGRGLLVAVIVALAVAVAACGSGPDGEAAAGEPAPDFSLELAGGEIFTRSEHDGPLALVFWAEWCPTCRRKLPVIDALAAEFDEVTFVAPAWKGTPEATAARAAELLPSGRVLWGLDADEDVFTAYEVPYQPVTVLVAADGTITERWAGGRSEGAIRSSLGALLDE